MNTRGFRWLTIAAAGVAFVLAVGYGCGALGGGVARNAAEKVYQDVEAPLTAADVADVIAFALNAPGHVNLDLVTMRPVAQSAQHLLARGPLRPRGDDGGRA